MKKGIAIAGAAALVLASALLIGNTVLACGDQAAKVAAASGCSGKSAAPVQAEASRAVYPISNGVILVYDARGDSAVRAVQKAGAHGCKAGCALQHAAKTETVAAGESGCSKAAKAHEMAAAGKSGCSKASRAELVAAAEAGCAKSKAKLAMLEKYEDPAARAELVKMADAGCAKSKAVLAELREYGYAAEEAAGDGGCPHAAKAAKMAAGDGGCPHAAKAAKMAAGDSGCPHAAKAAKMAAADHVEGCSGCCAKKAEAVRMAAAGCGVGCLEKTGLLDENGVDVETIQTPNGSIVVVTSRRQRLVQKLHAWAEQVNEGGNRVERASL